MTSYLPFMGISRLSSITQFSENDEQALNVAGKITDDVKALTPLSLIN